MRCDAPVKEHANLLSQDEQHSRTTVRALRQLTFRVLLVALALSLCCLAFSAVSRRPDSLDHSAHDLTVCAWKSLHHHTLLLDVQPITHGEFIQRQTDLAQAISEAGVDAFIAEPSASSAYYANVSSAYELSERPFLIIIDAQGRFSYLAPKFELGRISGLSMAYKEKTVFEWTEEESPYAVLRNETGFGKVILDEHARYMIGTGLTEAGIEVVSAPFKIQSLRAVKSAAEIDILKGVNRFTLELVRSLQKCIKVGMSQELITSAALNLFTYAGIGDGFWAIVLFGEQAAKPHGGDTGRVLRDGEFVLIDIGSSLHGYGSDVTRTVLPQHAQVSNALLDIWHIVKDAQSAAIDLMLPETTCSSADFAARQLIRDRGYGPYFTHRLGHGLGLEMHEHPYLNGANHEPLRAGNVVTNEPGIYVTEEQAGDVNSTVGFGVRIEDAVVVTRDGAVLLTGSRAKSPYEP